MSILTEPIHTLRHDESSLAAFDGKTILAVNVATKCGLTPQYTGLEALQEKYSDRGSPWNFEKFLIAPDGAVTRFAPTVTPEDPALVGAIEASLPG